MQGLKLETPMTAHASRSLPSLWHHRPEAEQQSLAGGCGRLAGSGSSAVLTGDFLGDWERWHVW